MKILEVFLLLQNTREKQQLLQRRALPRELGRKSQSGLWSHFDGEVPGSEGGARKDEDCGNY